MNLLHLLRWIRANTSIEVHTLILEPGPLVRRFEQCGDVTVVRGIGAARLFALCDGGLHAPWTRQARQAVTAGRLAAQIRHLRDFDLTYLNSAASLAIADRLAPSTCVVSHIHELNVGLRLLPPGVQRLLRQAPDGWIAASPPVGRLLVDDVGLPADRVIVRDEFITARDLADRIVSARDVEACRREVALSPESALVLGSGTLDWRKGVDLFVQLATEVRRRTRRPIRFVWLGGRHEGPDWERVRSDRDRAGADNVHFLPERDDPVPWFAAADVFALTSREDPLPLVALEAAALGTPIVTYRNGGLPGLLEAAGPDAAAGIVDHLDVGALAERAIDRLQGDGRRQAGIDQARSRVLAHHDVGVTAPRLVADLEAMFEAKVNPSVGRPRVPPTARQATPVGESAAAAAARPPTASLG
jgi:glycosyltransferase involved in cell wall biosynthesis